MAGSSWIKTLYIYWSLTKTKTKQKEKNLTNKMAKTFRMLSKPEPGINSLSNWVKCLHFWLSRCILIRCIKSLLESTCCASQMIFWSERKCLVSTALPNMVNKSWLTALCVHVVFLWPLPIIIHHPHLDYSTANLHFNYSPKLQWAEDIPTCHIV